MRLPRLILVSVSAAALSLFPACKQGEDEEEEEEEVTDAPATPSPYTMSLDLNISEDTPAESMAFAATTAGTNAGIAALILTATGASVGLQMAVPVLSLRRALEEDATRVSEGVYLWSYDFTNDNATWTANLTGTVVDATSMTWSMAMTRTPTQANGCCQNFVFYTGTQTNAGQAGTWQVFDPTRSEAQENLFQIAYSYVSENERTLTYTVNSDKAPSERFGNGSTVAYTVTANTFTLVVDDSSETGEHTVVVNRADKSGSYVNTDGDSFCWGPLSDDQPNVACE
jgi:hypothetical protein